MKSSQTPFARLRYGLACTLLVALILLLGLFGSPASEGGKPWDVFVACGHAGLVGWAALVPLARARAISGLPASFFHALHVYAARLTAVLALAHAVLLIAYEPALLADLRLGGPVSMWAGGGSLLALMLLAWIPWQDCKSIYERRVQRFTHIALALLAAGLALVHVLVGRYRDPDWRHALWIGLVAVATIAVAYRHIARRGTPAPVIDKDEAHRVRPLARNAALLTMLIVLTVLASYAGFA